MTFMYGLRNVPMVKGWGLWSRDLGSIPWASSHLWISCGVPFILERSLRLGHGYRAWFEYCALRCTLERISLSALRLGLIVPADWRCVIEFSILVKKGSFLMNSGSQILSRRIIGCYKWVDKYISDIFSSNWHQLLWISLSSNRGELYTS